MKIGCSSWSVVCWHRTRPVESRRSSSRAWNSRGTFPFLFIFRFVLISRSLFTSVRVPFPFPFPYAYPYIECCSAECSLTHSTSFPLLDYRSILYIFVFTGLTWHLFSHWLHQSIDLFYSVVLIFLQKTILYLPLSNYPSPTPNEILIIIEIKWSFIYFVFDFEFPSPTSPFH